MENNSCCWYPYPQMSMFRYRVEKIGDKNSAAVQFYCASIPGCNVQCSLGGGFNSLEKYYSQLLWFPHVGLETKKYPSTTFRTYIQIASVSFRMVQPDRQIASVWRYKTQSPGRFQNVPKSRRLKVSMSGRIRLVLGKMDFWTMFFGSFNAWCPSFSA